MGSTRLLATLAAIAVAAGVLVPIAAAPTAVAQAQTPPVDTDSSTWDYGFGQSYLDGLNAVYELDMCRDEATANVDYDDEAWSVWTEAFDGFFYSWSRTKTVVDGDCTIVYTYTVAAFSSTFDDAIPTALTFMVTGPVLEEETRFSDCATTPCPDRAGSLAVPRPCRKEAQAIIDNSDPPDSTEVEQDNILRTTVHTWVRGVCTITQTLVHGLSAGGSVSTLRNFFVRHVFEIPEPSDDRVSGQGRDYAALLSNLASRLAECGAEAAANGSRSTGTWGHGNPFSTERGPNTRRVVTKIVTAGQCQITYSVAEEFSGNRWLVAGLTLSYKKFSSAPPRTPKPPEGPGDKRDNCLPAQGRHFPHLCTSTIPESKLTQCTAGAAAKRPDLCDGATIVSDDAPDPYVVKWREQEAEKKRKRDEEATAGG